MVRMIPFETRSDARRSAVPQHQVAALCWRKAQGRKEVLLITSRDTGRWVVPKGWPIPGLTDAQAAMREAWEEAGVRADAAKSRRVGQFDYKKGLDDGRRLPVVADVYKVRLRDGQLADRFPEFGQRKRAWVPTKKAAKLVQEPALKELLRRL